MGETSSKFLDIAKNPKDWWSLNKACNAASFGIEDIKSAVSQAGDHVRNATRAGGLLKIDPGILTRLQQALDKLGEVKKQIDQLDNVCKGVAAFSRIKKAIDF